MNDKKFNKEDFEDLFDYSSNYITIGMKYNEDGLELRHFQNKHIEPKQAIAIAKAILAFYEKNTAAIIKDREDYIAKRKKEDFWDDVRDLYKDAKKDVREKILTYDKRGRNRGFTCKNCNDKYSTKTAQHLNMKYIYLHYYIDQSQPMFFDYEDSIDYKSEREEELFYQLEKDCVKLTGTYCCKDCAIEAVNALFHSYFPDGNHLR